LGVKVRALADPKHSVYAGIRDVVIRNAGHTVPGPGRAADDTIAADQPFSGSVWTICSA
jgi:hypothetical protein